MNGKTLFPRLMEALWDAGGVNCQVLETGTIRVGDIVQVVEASSGTSPRIEVDEGLRPSGFFVRPSQRSAAMVREAWAKKKQSLAPLLAADPEGVARAQASYASVGLKFWPNLE